MVKEIEMNMLRERALPLPSVTEEMFKTCNPHNVMMVEQYLQTSNTLSPHTLKQYRSGLYQFTYYLKQNLMDKPFYKVSKLDFKRYMSYLVARKMSSSGLKFKQSSVSAFCSKFLEVFIVETEEEYKTFRNFTTGVISIPKNQVYNKIPISEDEYKIMIKTLEEDGNLMGVAWVATMFNVGCRRAEVIQFKTEILTYDKKGKNYVISHKVRAKGKGLDGKIVEYMIPNEALEHMSKWVDSRKFDSEYIFATNHGGNPRMIDEEWGNTFCSDVLSDIVGRRINVHLFKSSAITHLLAQGKPMKVVSKYVAQHEDISTTQKFYDLRSDDDEKDGLFD